MIASNRYALCLSKGALALAALACLAAPARAQNRERQMYVSVIDEAGAPVKDLGPSDLVVREDGVAREVLRVRPATDPMQIALLVDNSQAATPSISNLREALTAFVRQMTPKNEIALITYGDRPTIVAEYTQNTALLEKGVDRLFAQPGSGGYVLDALVEAARGLRKREAARPVIVVVGTEGIEFSTLHYDQVLKPLLESGAAMHVLVLSSTSGEAALASEEVRNRNIVFDRGTVRTGGRRENLLTAMAFKDELHELGVELGSQYLVTYARPQSLIPPETVTVSSTKPGLTARGTAVRSTTPTQ
jgi:Ca-activated chloride channel family protein